MSSDGVDHDYTGADNLETMKAAKNYNAYLLGLIRSVYTSSGNILDFGAGAGTYADMAAADNQNVVCVEPDESLRQKLTLADFQVAADIQNIKSESVDGFYSLNVLEHIEDDFAAAKELFRCLRPGGVGLVYVPAMQMLFSSMDEKVCHYRRYSRKELVCLMRAAGFIVERSAYADSLGFFATLIYKWFGRSDGGINKSSLIIYDRFAFPLSRLCDVFFRNYFGKNTFVLVRKPDGKEL